MTISRKEALEQLELEAGDGGRLLEEPAGQWRLAMRRFRGRRSGMAGLMIVMALVVVALFAPLIAPYEPNDILIGKEDITRRDPPCVHVLGCDAEVP